MPTSPTNQPATPAPTSAKDTEDESAVAASRKHYCPNHCSGNGACFNGCQCFPGFGGIDCSIRTCPAGRAWFDFPTATDVAHQNNTECSNMGNCNRDTGICECRDGYGGPACDKMNCPIGLNPNGIVSPCYGNGRCISLREASQFQDYDTFNTKTVYNGWDADMIYGCDCDAGFAGVSCNQTACPFGVDPLATGVSEKQLIDCRCDDSGGACTGGLRVTFRGQITATIPWQGSAATLKRALEKLNTVEVVNVKLVLGSTICDATPGSITEVEFMLPAGDVPAMAVEAVGGFDGFMDVKVHTYGSDLEWGHVGRQGTTVATECSSRGTCSETTGLCSCFTDFSSSDGAGGQGSRGDCAYTADVNAVDCPSTTVGEGDDAVTTACSGTGTCVEKHCVCNAGYEGGDCSLKSCGSATTIWGDILEDRSGTSVCSGVGDCDHTTGLCTNCGGNWLHFTGDSCEMMSCVQAVDPNDGALKTCAGNGVCMSLKEMAPYSYNDQKEMADYTYTTPWDADWVRGCACYRAVSIDNQFYQNYVIPADGTSYPTGLTLENDGEASLSDVSLSYDLTKYYRGPYAYTATDWTGFTCADAKCPKGDDPTTPVGRDEIQNFQCIADSGTYQLFFRENVTAFIDHDATAAVLQTKLEELFTVNYVLVLLHSTDVTIDAAHTVCSTDTTRYAEIVFLTEFGDLPMLQVVSSSLTLSGGTVVTTITEAAKGTKEDVECSGNGICGTNGVCECMPGYMSSNGTNNMNGEKGDCTYFNPLYTEHFSVKVEK